VQKKSLSEHHLPGPQRAAPAAVGGQGGAGQRGQLLPVGEPHPGRKILPESLGVPHHAVFVGGFWNAVVIWGRGRK